MKSSGRLVGAFFVAFNHETLLLFCLLLALHYAGRAQEALPHYVGVYYKFADNTAGYESLRDTAIVGSPATAAAFHKNGQLLITGFPTAGWAEGVRAGKHYFVRTKALAAYERPRPETLKTPEVIPGAQSSQRYYGGTHDIQTGPRGGRYYINSTGNKTYIRRK